MRVLINFGGIKMVKEIGKNEFESEVLGSEMPVVIDFWAPWCQPCLMMGPVFQELGDEMKESVKFVKVNVDSEPELAGAFKVQGIPTISVVKGQQEIGRMSGFMSKDQLKEKINGFISKSK